MALNPTLSVLSLSRKSTSYYAYIANPFLVAPADLPAGTREQVELIGIQPDEGEQKKKITGHSLIVPNSSSSR